MGHQDQRQSQLDRDFACSVDRIVTRIFPTIEPKDRVDMEAELAGLAQCIMLQTIHHISSQSCPWNADQKGTNE